jgi:hypothetical protein
MSALLYRMLPQDCIVDDWSYSRLISKMGGTVNKILSTASAYVHRQDDLETIDNFLFLRQIEQDKDKP